MRHTVASPLPEVSHREKERESESESDKKRAIGERLVNQLLSPKKVCIVQVKV